MASTVQGRETLRAFVDKDNPYYLLNLFGLLCLLSVAVILLLVGYGMHRVYSGEMLRNSEQDAVAVGQGIFEQERKVLLAPDPAGGERIAVTRENLAALDERMRRYLRPFHIYKIKIYSRDKTVVYSTDQAIIGQLDSGNARLERVLRLGEVISDLVSKERVGDLAGEQRFDVDVVETYLPVKSGNAIVGSFEIYVDVTSVRRRIAKALTWSVAVLFLVLVAVFASLYVLMRKKAFQLKQAQDELRRLAVTDMLTGLFNRRHLMARAREEYSRVRREAKEGEVKGVVGFIMADLDYFKRTNDTYGHLVGDEVLRAVSERLRNVLRVYDVIGRYGGEEFLVLMPGTDLEDAKICAERMRHAVESAPIVVGTRSLNVTMSFGVTCTDTGDPDEIAALARADKALYKAKGAGRNRVEWL